MLIKFCEKRMQVSSALAYLHSVEPYPILHHNLKPSNILGVLVGSDSESGKRLIWKLADFGIAKLLNMDAQGDFYTSTAIGTPIYMAPEVITFFKCVYNFTACSAKLLYLDDVMRAFSNLIVTLN